MSRFKCTTCADHCNEHAVTSMLHTNRDLDADLTMNASLHPVRMCQRASPGESLHWRSTSTFRARDAGDRDRLWAMWHHEHQAGARTAWLWTLLSHESEPRLAWRCFKSEPVAPLFNSCRGSSAHPLVDAVSCQSFRACPRFSGGIWATARPASLD